ncbi:MAG: hypothetical protein LC099_04225 [Anaerolineales bacterium]|nr:hypothetical protein [Anaerolineales bacterium]
MKSSSFKSWIAVLIAFVTVMGAAAACFAAAAVSNAGDNDFDGLDAAFRRQKTEIINQVSAYEHYRAFASYTRYNELGNSYYDPNSNADSATNARNAALQREAWSLASGISANFFDPRYVSPEGQYNLQRELQEAYAQAAQNEELDSAPYFEESDKQRSSATRFSGVMIIFAVSFWFFTLAQAAEKNVKYLWALLGIFIGLAGVVAILAEKFLR